MLRSVILFFISALIVNAQVNKFAEPGIDFNPKHYVVYKTDKPLKIDGKADEAAWQNAIWTDYFSDIEGILKPAPRFKTRVKMLWDSKYLYISGELEEPHLSASIKKRDEVIFYDNDFEVFIDPDGDTHKYYELEINALATAWDLLLVKPYREDNNVAYNGWDIKGLKVAAALQGTLNNGNDTDKGWTCEIAIPWASLRETYDNTSVPKPGEQWRINFSRVEWKYDWIDGKYIKVKDKKTGQALPEDNWVWSPQGVINMHYPEMWGFIQFSGKYAGSGVDEFVTYPGEKAKWALRKIYYAEHTYFNQTGSYTNDINKLSLNNYKVEGYSWPPEIEATKNLFMATVKSKNGKETIWIKQDGEVR